MSWGIAFRLRQQLKGSLTPSRSSAPCSARCSVSSPSGSTARPEGRHSPAATACQRPRRAMVALLGFVVTIGVLVVQWHRHARP